MHSRNNKQIYVYIYAAETAKQTTKHLITKLPARTLEFKNFEYFAKKFSDTRQKREKHPHPASSSCAWAGLWPAITRALSTSRSFQTFLKHNVGNSAEKQLQSVVLEHK